MHQKLRTRFVHAVLDYQADLSFIKVTFSDMPESCEWVAFHELFVHDDSTFPALRRRIGSIRDRMWDLALTRITFADQARETEWIADNQLYVLDDSANLPNLEASLHVGCALPAAPEEIEVDANEPVRHTIDARGPDALLSATSPFITRRIHYGTAYMPRTSPSILLPQWDSRMPFSPSKNHDYRLLCDGIIGVNTRYSRSAGYNGTYPSISTILGATRDYGALYKWQRRLVLEHGAEYLQALMAEKSRRGTDFHNLMLIVIEDMQRCGLPPTDDEIYQRATGKKITGYVTSVLPFIRSLKPSRCVLTETWTNHHALFYRGRLDALVPINGVLTLVDWKTTGRRPNTTHEEKDVFNALYDHPLQLAAYAAAFNADIAYRRFPAVKQCALIQCFEDGSPCEVLLMRDHQVKVYFEKFLMRLNKFWWMLGSLPVAPCGSVSVEYAPPAESEVIT